MGKITKRVVDAAEARANDYVIWDDELPGFGLRVFVSGKRSYVIQYRAAGRSRRYTIGFHGVWTPETARQEAKVLLGRIAKGDDPAEERRLDHKAITMKELCAVYLSDLDAGLILGKGGRPKKATTISTDRGRIARHIIPLIGTRKVRDVTKADVNRVLRDLIAGKTATVVKTQHLRARQSSAAAWGQPLERSVCLAAYSPTPSIPESSTRILPTEFVSQRITSGCGASPSPNIVCSARFLPTPGKMAHTPLQPRLAG